MGEGLSATLALGRDRRRPGWVAAVRALTHSSTRCPSCHSDDTRPSRVVYLGRIAATLDLAPFRCRECGRLFPTTPAARRHHSPHRALLSFPPDSE